MSREAHVRFDGSGEGQFLPATLLNGTREPVVSLSLCLQREREYVEAKSRRREYRMRRTGADWGVVAMKGL